MNIERWWPRSKLATQAWLIANDGDVVTAEAAANGESPEAYRS